MPDTQAHKDRHLSVVRTEATRRDTSPEKTRILGLVTDVELLWPIVDGEELRAYEIHDHIEKVDGEKPDRVID